MTSLVVEPEKNLPSQDRYRIPDIRTVDQAEESTIPFPGYVPDKRDKNVHRHALSPMDHFQI